MIFIATIILNKRGIVVEIKHYPMKNILEKLNYTWEMS